MSKKYSTSIISVIAIAQKGISGLLKHPKMLVKIS